MNSSHKPNDKAKGTGTLSSIKIFAVVVVIALLLSHKYLVAKTSTVTGHKAEPKEVTYKDGLLALVNKPFTKIFSSSYNLVSVSNDKTVCRLVNDIDRYALYSSNNGDRFSLFNLGDKVKADRSGATLSTGGFTKPNMKTTPKRIIKDPIYLNNNVVIFNVNLYSDIKDNIYVFSPNLVINEGMKAWKFEAILNSDALHQYAKCVNHIKQLKQ